MHYFLDMNRKVDFFYARHPVTWNDQATHVTIDKVHANGIEVADVASRNEHETSLELNQVNVDEI